MSEPTNSLVWSPLVPVCRTKVQARAVPSTSVAQRSRQIPPREQKIAFSGSLILGRWELGGGGTTPLVGTALKEPHSRSVLEDKLAGSEHIGAKRKAKVKYPSQPPTNSKMRGDLGGNLEVLISNWPTQPTQSNSDYWAETKLGVHAKERFKSLASSLIIWRRLLMWFSWTCSSQIRSSCEWQL